MQKWIIALCIALVFSGCATTKSVREIKGQLSKIQNDNQLKHEELDARLEQFNKEIQYNREGLIKMGTEFNNLQLQTAELNRVFGLIDSVNARVTIVSKQINVPMDMLNFNTDRITTVYDEIMDNTKRVIGMQQEFEQVKKRAQRADSLASLLNDGKLSKSVSTLEANQKVLAKTVENLQQASSLKSDFNKSTTDAAAKIKELQKSDEEIKSKISQLESDLKKKDTGGKVTDLSQDYKDKINGLKKDFNTLTSQVDDLRQKLNVLQSDKIMMPSREPEQKLVEQTSPKETKTTNLVKDDATIQYEAAKSLYDSRKFDKAISSFDQFLQNYPAHKLAINAQYWKAESYYGEGDYYTAMHNFQKVIDNYPKCEKGADAMTKLGLCYIKLNDRDAAYQILVQIADKYPDYVRQASVNKILSEIK